MFCILVDKYIRQRKGMVADKKAMPRGYFIKIPEPTRKPQGRLVKLFIGLQLSFSVHQNLLSVLTLWQVLF